MLRAVICDFDGVIADSEPLHFEAFSCVLPEYGIELSRQEYYEKYLGYTDLDCIKVLAADKRIVMNSRQIDEFVKKKGDVFTRIVKASNIVIDGVEPFLKMLKKHNLPIAICSGAFLSDIEMILNNTNLKNYFEVIVAADHIKKGKPDPEGFILTLQKLNLKQAKPISPSQCVVVEDSMWGLEAAKAAGMHTLAVTGTYSAEDLTMAEKITGAICDVTMEQLQAVCGF